MRLTPRELPVERLVEILNERIPEILWDKGLIDWRVAQPSDGFIRVNLGVRRPGGGLVSVEMIIDPLEPMLDRRSVSDQARTHLERLRRKIRNVRHFDFIR